jgi:hypothetical protein
MHRRFYGEGLVPLSMEALFEAHILQRWPKKNTLPGADPRPVVICLTLGRLTSKREP